MKRPQKRIWVFFRDGVYGDRIYLSAKHARAEWRNKTWKLVGYRLASPVQGPDK